MHTLQHEISRLLAKRDYHGFDTWFINLGLTGNSADDRKKINHYWSNVLGNLKTDTSEIRLFLSNECDLQAYLISFSTIVAPFIAENVKCQQ